MNAVLESTVRTVGALYIEACQEIGAAYGVKLDHAADAPTEIVVGKGHFRSVLALTGSDIRLTSILTMEDSLLVAMHAATAAGGPPADLADWGREFSNQLGGRLKNKLLPIGIEVRVGLAASGPLVALPPGDAAEVQRCFFNSANGWLSGELAVQMAPAFSVPVAPLALQGDALLEGMFLMF